MSTGYIQVSAFIANQGLPVGGASVMVTGQENGTMGQVASVQTDGAGLTPVIEVETPPVQLSRDASNTQQPYALYNIQITAPGYLPITVENVQVFEGQTALQYVEMLPQTRGRSAPAEDTNVDIPPHSLYRAAPNAGEFVEGPLRDGRTLREVVIPETIVVHLGTPSSSARNVYVPFKDYIKNVASSEIYPTWDEQAIRANVYAILSFTLNRIYTEWYRSRGYDFQITNTTSYDQAYVHGRNIYENVGRVVDEIFDQYLRRPGATNPFFSSYCDGRQTNCEGLKQWGTQELASQGYDYNQILDYYYGPLDIATAPQVEGIPLSYPGQPLRLGDNNEDVRRVQGWLTRISENYPLIGNVPPTGNFDTRTQDAVRAFQRTFQLTADGVVGRATWYKIVQIYVSVMRLGELDAEAEGSEGASSAYPGYIVREGQRGANVRTVQSILALLSTFYEEIDPVDVDGIFGPATTQAVRQFQQLMGLSVDGLVGRATWDSLQDEYEGAQEDISGVEDPYPGVLIRMGSRGESVRKVQTYMNAIAEDYPQIPTTSVDGVFGQGTQNQVRAYQQQFGLPVDGVVGVNTWDSMVTTYNNLNVPNEDVIETFGPQQAGIRKELIGPSYPPVGFNPPFTIPGQTNNNNNTRPPITTPPSGGGNAGAFPEQPQTPSTPPDGGIIGPRGSVPTGRYSSDSGNTSSQWGRTETPYATRNNPVTNQMISQYRREQELAFRTLFNLVQQGILDRHTWDVLAPLRAMILGLPPYDHPDNYPTANPLPAPSTPPPSNNATRPTQGGNAGMASGNNMNMWNEMNNNMNNGMNNNNRPNNNSNNNQ